MTIALALEIKKIRLTLGLTQQEFGDLLGITSTCVVYWETDRRNPSMFSIKKMLRLARKCGVKVDTNIFIN